MGGMDDVQEIIMTEQHSPLLTCIHCKRELSDDDFQRAVLLYGVILLKGKDDGIVGITCPICLKTTHSNTDISTFQQIVNSFDQPWLGGTQLPPDLLRYYSPCSSYLAREQTAFHYCSPGDHYDQDALEILEQEVQQYESDIIFPDETIYHTYLQELPQTTGSFFYALWLTSGQVTEFLNEEARTKTKTLPRYIYQCEPIETTEGFCWDYRLAEIYYEKKEKSMEENSLNVTTEFLDSGDDLEPLPEWYDFFLDKHKEAQKEDKSITLTLHKILIDDSMGFILNDELKIFCKKRYPFVKVENQMPFYEIKLDRNEEEAKYFEEQRDQLQKYFHKDFAQKFLLEAADDFIHDYLEEVKKTRWSYAELWALQQRYLRRYYLNVRRGLSAEANYAFYQQGEAWKIIFDGKPIAGLALGGFKYIHFLMCHENELFSHMELNNLCGGVPPNELTREYSNDNPLLEWSDTFPLNDSKGRQIMEAEIQRLTEEILYATAINDEINVVALEKNLEQVEQYYDNCFHKSGKIKTERGKYKNAQDKIGKAIKDAVFMLVEKGYMDVAVHFKKSIPRTHANKISYISVDDKIKWHF